MTRWLVRTAGQLPPACLPAGCPGVFAQWPGAVCQAILLTDGQNGPEDERPLQAELQSCAGLFQAHCQGVGTDWSPAELRRIAERLLGTA